MRSGSVILAFIAALSGEPGSRCADPAFPRAGRSLTVPTLDRRHRSPLCRWMPIRWVDLC